MIAHQQVKNTPSDVTDVDCNDHFFGVDVGALKDKTVWLCLALIVTLRLMAVPHPIFEKHEYMRLSQLIFYLLTN